MKIGNGLAIILSSLIMHSSLLHAAIIIDVSESDGDVIASAEGSINTAALTLFQRTTLTNGFTYGSGYDSTFDGVLVLATFSFSAHDFYIIDTTIAFSTGASFFDAMTNSGSAIGIMSSNVVGNDRLIVPGNYVSNTPIMVSSTWSGTTITDLGLIPGTYVVTWGSDETADSLTINIDESVPTYSVGGTVSDLTGAGLALQNNGDDTLPVAADGPFTFVKELADGSDYLVTVSAQPTGQTCNVTSASGTLAGNDVSNVTVTCTKLETIFADSFEAPCQIDGIWAVEARDCIVEDCSGGDGRYQSWDGKIWCRALITQESEDWTIEVPPDVQIFDFWLDWGAWDLNNCGDGQSGISISACGLNEPVFRDAEEKHLTCDVTGLSSLTIVREKGEDCEYIIIGNPYFY